ncbi:MAG TPA: bifunctional 23S rRNA (guanine(2069)-N(7))-methyltransferase RlmK/23S rRNA (guanine(2445)-N(2))-methyltransferase RlmL, partial [Pirellulales bacterium]|nr:bifunctional 23S rRNA (guanine(2069)-N(7))-methyltransferase RlmK/23S rRNA (guanine(2445)-N(2))-methyltransferase RlmL [Pirellulales bacterium]
VGEAQLKETMAAALILLSFWRPERQLVDPFCGSGTIPIEAALIGRNLAPGLNRTFAAENWPAIPARLWEEARQEARDLARPDLPLRIIGTDKSEEALSLARYHAEQAGVSEQIHFQQRDFYDLTSKKEYGCVICNPPYGARIGEHDELEDLYRAMPTVLRRLKTWSHYVLTAFPDFETLVGRKADRRRKLYNARIECTYYQFYGPKPGTYLAPDAVQPKEDDELGTRSSERGAAEEQSALSQTTLASGGLEPSSPDADREMRNSERGSADRAEPVADIRETEPARAKPKPPPPIARPAFGGLSAKSREQGELFARRLTTRAKHLRRWPTKRGITCFRLYDRDVPEIPLAVDRYEDCLHLAEYERPHDRSPGEHADWLDLMARTAGQTLGVAPSNVFMKRRERQRGAAQYERFADSGRTIVVGEGGLKFRVNLSDYLDTGLFLDHRITRSMVREQAEGKRFLNLFGYTGSFSVYAAAGGAAATTTVDLSNTYLQWAEDNFQLNELAGRRHRFVRDDALSFLKFHPPGAAYDLAVVDPPTFSNSKKTDDVWDVQQGHAELLRLLIALMAPGGVIFFSTNSRRFKLAESELHGVSIREISRQTVPEDFRNQRIHRCWRMAVGETGDGAP